VRGNCHATKYAFQNPCASRMLDVNSDNIVHDAVVLIQDENISCG